MIDFGDVDLKALDDDARTAIIDGDIDRGLELFERLWQAAWPRRGEEDARFYLEVGCRDLAEYFLTNGQPARARVWVERYHQVLGTDRPMDPTSAIYDIALSYESGDLEGAYQRAKELYDIHGAALFHGDEFEEKYEKWFRNYFPSGPAHPRIPVVNSGSDTALPNELPDDLYQRITALWDRMEALADQEVYVDVIPLAIEALNLLPQPLSHWEVATQLYGLLAEACYREGQLEEAEQASREALTCPGGTDNPMIWCVLGMALKDQGGRKPQALDALMSAYMLDGTDVFEELGFDTGLEALKNDNLI